MLSLRHIHLQKGSFTLKKVSFDVQDFDYFVILGRTGSGKTLLLETIAGLHKNAGTVSYHGRDITHIPPEKRKIGFVYQDFALFPHLSVVKNIRFSDRYQKQSKDSRWDELIDFLDLEDLLHRDIRYLSGGEKQRVALARAIYSRPDILLLDEPLSAIDPSFRNTIMENLKGLNHRFQITVVHVTHNFREAAYLADKIGIMMDGKLVQQGSVQKVLQHPDTVPIARFLGFKNILPDRLLTSDPEGRYFSLNPALIEISDHTLDRDHNISGNCLEKREDTDHFKLIFDVNGCSVFVKIAKQSYDPAIIQVGAALNLSFSHSAVTRFQASESLDEASV
jgi:molybdate/tungstate transport system ATP-binding protein